MAKRVRGQHEVTLYAKGHRYGAQYPGFGLKHTMAALHKQNRLWLSTFDGAGQGLVGADSTAPSACYMEFGDGAIVMPTPYREFVSEVSLSDFNEHSGTWETLTDWTTKDTGGDHPGYVLMQRDGTEDVISHIESDFNLPANPFISLSLWRGEACRDEVRDGYYPRTEIGFGRIDGTQIQFILYVPYDGPAYLAAWNRVTEQYDRLPPIGGQLPSTGGIDAGKQLDIDICCLPGAIGICFDRGREGQAFVAHHMPEELFEGVQEWEWYEAPEDWEGEGEDGLYLVWTKMPVPMMVREGPLVVWHNAGMVAFRWWPIYMEPAACAYSGAVDLQYPVWQAPAGYVPTSATSFLFADAVWELGVGGDAQKVANSDVGVWPYNPRGAKTTDGTEVSWFAGLPVVTHTLTTGVETCTGAALAGVHLQADPYVYDEAAWPSTTDITGDVQRITIDASGEVSIAKLVLRNNKGTYSTLAENQFVAIKLGYEWDDSSTNEALVFCGYVAATGEQAQPGPQEMLEATLYDPLIRLRSMKCWGHEPDGQTMTAKAAIEFLAARAGMHANQMTLLGSDARMSLGAGGPDGDPDEGRGGPYNDGLVPSFGADLLTVALEYARRDDESLLYCVPDATHGWVLHKTNGAPGASDGTLYTLEEDGDADEYHIYDVQEHSVSMHAQEYADHIALRGKDPQGAPFTTFALDASRLTDPDDPDWNGGWPRTYAEARDHYDDPAAAQVAAQALLEERKRTASMVTVRTDIIAAVRRGDRFKLAHDSASGRLHNAGIRNHIYRVTGFSHEWEGPGTMPRTMLTGRDLGEAT